MSKKEELLRAFCAATSLAKLILMSPFAKDSLAASKPPFFPFFLKFHKRMCSEACEKHGLLLQKTCTPILLFPFVPLIQPDGVFKVLTQLVHQLAVSYFISYSPRLCGVWGFYHRLLNTYFSYLTCWMCNSVPFLRRHQAFHHPRRPLRCCFA